MSNATETPVTEIKRRATAILARLRRDHIPVLITEHGRSSAMLVDLETYNGLLRRLALLEGIARGERAYADGRIVSHADAKRRLSRWLEAPR